MKKVKPRRKRYFILKKVRFLIFMIVMVGCMAQLIDVDAGMNDTVMNKNRIDGVYSVANIRGDLHLYYLDMYEMNGIISYCIDLGTPITTDIYHSTSDFSISYLPEGQIEYIRSISYFGYQYAGHDDYRYYMAAQEIIWEYLGNGGVEVEWTDVLDVNGKRINIDSYKREILELMSNYYKRVSFDWIDGSVVKVGEEISLFDFAYVLSEYEIVSSGHSDVKIEGNILKIKIGNDYVGRDSIVLKKKEYYSFDSMLYYYDSSQRMISSGNFKNFKKEIYFNVSGAELNVQVVDQQTGKNIALGQATLKGAIYELYRQDGNLLGTFETNDTGYFTVDNLPYGSYYLKQVKPSLGYQLNEEILYFDFIDDTFLLTVEQQVISKFVEIVKIYGGVEGEYYFEPDVSFSVIDFNGDLYDYIVTDLNGYSSIWLPYGQYIIHQNNTNFGYSKVDDFTVLIDASQEDVIRYELIDPLIECAVRIVTRDKSNGDILALEGFSYRVRASDQENYMMLDGKDVFTTDLDGELVLPMVFVYGDYILEQVQTATGYILNEEKIEFSLNDYTNFEIVDHQLRVDVDVYNQEVLGRINVLANQEIFFSEYNNYYYQRVPREGSSFLLIANEDIIVNGSLQYQKGQEVISGVTDVDGRYLIENIHLGNYCLLDQDSGQKECFILKDSLQGKDVVVKDLEFTLLVTKNDVVIQNVSDLGDSVVGATFEILDKDKKVIYTGLTDEDGIIKVVGLPVGDYCIHQKNVPSGYLMKKEDSCIFLDSTQMIQVTNQLGTQKWISVPNTFYRSKDYFKLFILFGMGIGVFFYKKVFTSKF